MASVAGDGPARLGVAAPLPRGMGNMAMVAVLSLLIIVLVSLLVTRLATVALTLTGLSREAARFQARSALTGTGFTTSEAESVVAHPVRRRIIMVLMLLGSAGLVTAAATLLLSFSGAGGAAASRRAGLLAGGLVMLWLAARSPWADRWLSNAIERLLRRWVPTGRRDHITLLSLPHEWAVAELQVREGDWMAGRSLLDLDLAHEGVLVLGIERVDGSYVGAPKGTTTLDAGDVVVIYGRRSAIEELDARPSGPRGERRRRTARNRFRSELARQEAGNEEQRPHAGGG